MACSLVERQKGALENGRKFGGDPPETGYFEVEILRDNLRWGTNELVGRHDECGPGSAKTAVGERYLRAEHGNDIE